MLLKVKQICCQISPRLKLNSFNKEQLTFIKHPVWTPCQVLYTQYEMQSLNSGVGTIISHLKPEARKINNKVTQLVTRRACTPSYTSFHKISLSLEHLLNTCMLGTGFTIKKTHFLPLKRTIQCK